MNELLPIKSPNLPELFAPGGLDEILSGIEGMARSITPDIGTAKGRREIASVAARVASSKTYLDGLGKDFVSGLKAQTKAVDAVRKDARDRLDALKEEVRRPLNAWEEAERDRKQAHEANINQMMDCLRMSADDSREDIDAAIQLLDSIPSDAEHWEEYAEQALSARSEAAGHLNRVFNARKQRDAEAEELLRLREEAARREAQEAAEQAKLEQAERDRRIADEAVMRARKEAEAAAEKERLAQERNREEERQRAERERQHAESEAARKIADAERRVAEAELAARRAAEQAKREADDEKRKAEEESERQRAENERRAANKAHRGSINREVRDALMATAWLTSEQATECVKAIASGNIPHTNIAY